MFLTSPAIVLSCVKHSDTTNIVTLYTQEMGSIPFALRISRSRKNAAQANLFQPLNQLIIEWDHRPTQSMQRIKNVRPLNPYTTLLYHPMKATIATFIAEILYHTLCHEHQGDILPYIQHSLLWLDTAQSNYANFHIIFLVRLTYFLGIQPQIEEPMPGTYFDLQNAEYTNFQPTHQYYLEPQTAQLLPLLMRFNFHTMHLLRLSRQQRAFILQQIITYYRLHITTIPKLRSLDILIEVYKA